jgi:gas vesicle protein
MNSETALLWICIAFTVALAIQVILLAVMAVASLRMRKQVNDLVAKAEPLIAKAGPIADTSQAILNDIRRYAGEIAAKSNDLLDISRKQLGRVDEVLAEATSRTRTQMDRIEMVMDDTVNRFQETTSLLQNGVVRPLRQLNALTAGIRAGVSFLAGGRRTTVEQATHDEEMFI